MIYFFDDYENFSAENFLGFLPEKRREKYEKTRQKRDKENCVISYLLLKKALKIFGIENEPWWMYVILIAVSDIFFFAYRYALAIFAFLYEKKLKKILRL